MHINLPLVAVERVRPTMLTRSNWAVGRPRPFRQAHSSLGSGGIRSSRRALLRSACGCSRAVRRLAPPEPKLIPGAEHVHRRHPNALSPRLADRPQPTHTSFRRACVGPQPGYPASAAARRSLRSHRKYCILALPTHGRDAASELDLL